jgi:2-oxoglutarate ferredoxin oxidoreductase subunit gamma
MKNLLLAGFGGQGILFAGKQLALAGMAANKEISWLPSYGPEMRGGTANCSITLSDTPIGSPIVDKPDVLIAMNLPSLDKYESTVAPGGTIYVDSTLISRKVARTDVTVHYIPATQMAKDAQIPSLANMIILGHLLRHHPEISEEGLDAVVAGLVPPKKAALVELNKKALAMGMDY